MKFEILGNTIELFLNENQEGREAISSNFNNKSRVKIITDGLDDILILSQEEGMRSLKYSICESITSRIKATAKNKKLSQIQELIINGNLCFYADEGNYIGIKYLRKC